MHRSRVIGALLAVALLAAGLAGVVVATERLAGADVTTVPSHCIAIAPIVGPQQADQNVDFEVVAPAAVPPGATFTITFAMPPTEFPGAQFGTPIGDVNISQYIDIGARLAIPANSELVSVGWVPGSGDHGTTGDNLGAGTPTIAPMTLPGGIDGFQAMVPGPVLTPGSGNHPFAFPAVELTLKATGSVGDTITTQPHGTSQTDWGFRLTPVLTGLGAGPVPTTCWPESPIPTLSTTNLVPDVVDPLEPEIVVPQDGGTYFQNSFNPAEYSCEDDELGSGIDTCVGTVPVGTGIDTATQGGKSFTVTATDNFGNTRSKTVNYTVVPAPTDNEPPTIDIVTPPNGAVYTVGEVVNASYTCDDDTAVQTCEGPVANGAPIDTSTPGPKTFQVNATDVSGNPASAATSYQVFEPVAPSIVDGPNNPGGTNNLSSGSSTAWNGSNRMWRLTSTVPNGGTVAPGHSFDFEWSFYKQHTTTSLSGSSTPGPDPFLVTIQAPSNTVIDGPVQFDMVTLGGQTNNNAYQNPGNVGLNSISPPSPVSNASSITVDFDGNSSPANSGFLGITRNHDGIAWHVTYTAKVVAPGTVTVPGFPVGSITGTSSSQGTFVAGAIAAPGVTFESVADIAPPTIDVVTPQPLAHYDYQSTVLAEYSCDDDVAVVACEGDVADGDPIDTSTGGLHTFHVYAEDAAGNTANVWIPYYVDVPGPIANDDSASVIAGGNVTIDVLANDVSSYHQSPSIYDPDPDSITIVTPPSGGNAVAGGGVVEYTHTNPAVFSDSFTYEVYSFEGTASNVATVSIEVGPLGCEGDASGGGCQLTQVIIVPVEPDVLGMTQAANEATLSGVFEGGDCVAGPLVLTGQPRVACGDLSEVTVVNNRGNDLHWDLTGQITDFTDGTLPVGYTCDDPADYDNHCVPGGNLGWTPAAAVGHALLPGDVAAVVPGSSIAHAPETPQPAAAPPPAPGLHDSAQQLCGAVVKHSGGTFLCNAQLRLTVPAYAAAGTYTAVLTLTLA